MPTENPDQLPIVVKTAIHGHDVVITGLVDRPSFLQLKVHIVGGGDHYPFGISDPYRPTVDPEGAEDFGFFLAVLAAELGFTDAAIADFSALLDLVHDITDAACPIISEWRSALGVLYRALPLCRNAEVGTYNHECNRLAKWVGLFSSGTRMLFCDDCRKNGHDARAVIKWEPLTTPWRSLTEKTEGVVFMTAEDGSFLALINGRLRSAVAGSADARLASQNPASTLSGWLRGALGFPVNDIERAQTARIVNRYGVDLTGDPINFDRVAAAIAAGDPS